MALFNQKNARKQLDAEAGKVHRADLETLLDRQRRLAQSPSPW